MIQCKTCPRLITRRQARRNAGLCETCMEKALQYVAEQLLKRKKGDK
jgi:hypothetical protein